ncbi:hypothetical protein BAUCODRAFT_380118 [Baudoinia panamericana UAMH 10762]|uniref:Uncharacterized protein n=1 Tax=Baudoinia panamericana (strain UAMH 10762) TaxID=717646 RepID=M2MPT7_BAUPA|nr:uncharacterized protein BAUCODRAFT_380118 [Baudoinia panamericana UAMH 10762]EMC98776.1 hypothetical protein BAUCODRAFT_380118 [Baudoinia panamericana UAMH 10762]
MKIYEVPRHLTRWWNFRYTRRPTLRLHPDLHALSCAQRGLRAVQKKFGNCLLNGRMGTCLERTLVVPAAKIRRGCSMNPPPKCSNPQRCIQSHREPEPEVRLRPESSY